MSRVLRPLNGWAFLLAAIPLAVFAQEPVTKSISLDEAVSMALANNPSVAISREQVVRTEAQVREAMARGLPQIAVNANYSKTRAVVAQFGEGQVEIVPSSSGAITGQVTQALDVFRLVKSCINLAEEQERIQRLELSRTERAVIYDTKTAYYNVLRAEAHTDVAQAGVDLAQERLRLAQAGFDAGTIARFDVTTADVEVANRRQALISAAANIEIAKAVLGNVIGVPNTTQVSVKPIKPTATEPGISFDQAVEKAYSSRPEVQAAESAVGLRRLAVNLTGKERLPLIGLFGQLERNLNPGAFGMSDTWRVGASVSWSIWQGGAISARVRQAEADLRAAEELLNQTKLAVGLDVQSALVSANETFSRLAVAEQSVGLAEDALELAQVRYKAGISTAIEVKGAELDLILARTNRINTIYDYETAIAGLQRATGQQSEAADRGQGV